MNSLDIITETFPEIPCELEEVCRVPSTIRICVEFLLYIFSSILKKHDSIESCLGKFSKDFSRQFYNPSCSSLKSSSIIFNWILKSFKSRVISELIHPRITPLISKKYSNEFLRNSPHIQKGITQMHYKLIHIFFMNSSYASSRIDYHLCVLEHKYFFCKIRRIFFQNFDSWLQQVSTRNILRKKKIWIGAWTSSWKKLSSIYRKDTIRNSSMNFLSNLGKIYLEILKWNSGRILSNFLLGSFKESSWGIYS